MAQDTFVQFDEFCLRTIGPTVAVGHPVHTHLRQLPPSIALSSIILGEESLDEAHPPPPYQSHLSVHVALGFKRMSCGYQDTTRDTRRRRVILRDREPTLALSCLVSPSRSFQLPRKYCLSLSGMSRPAGASWSQSPVPSRRVINLSKSRGLLTGR